MKVIEIPTDEAGLAIFNTTASSLEYHTTHLENINSWMALLDTLKSLSRGSNSLLPFNEYKLVLEYNSLLNISTLDLAVIVRQFYISTHKWERLYYAKHGYAIIYETIYTYDENNKKFYKLLGAKAPTVLEEFNLISDDLKKFKKDYGYQSIMGPIRKKVAAHIDSFKAYYNTINAIDTLHALKAIQEFILILNRLQDVTKNLINVYRHDFEKIIIPPTSHENPRKG